jgi:glycerophosphoryl diester phosphodiesterase
MLHPRAPRPIIIAHRGAHDTAQLIAENTIAAFERAIVLQADMIEFDVRTTRDQVHIIHHDPSINRIPINQLTWAEVHAYNPLIPTLTATLQHCQNRIPLDIELKSSGNEITIVELVCSYLPVDQFVITSFNPQSLQIIRQTYPNIKIGLLLKRSWRNLVDRHFSIQTHRSQITQLNLDYLVPHYDLLSEPWLQSINTHQIPYWVWTINQPNTIQTLLNTPDIAGIITDKCKQAIANN